MVPSTLRQRIQLTLKALGVKTHVLALALCSVFPLSQVHADPGYRVLGQPTLEDASYASRCADPNAQFNYSTAGGFEMYGPSGIAIDPRGRVYVTDFGGQRVLTWPDADALESCQPADGVIGAGELFGPEAVTVDVRSETVFVADTLRHVVKGYQRAADGTWALVVTLGIPDVSGNASNQFYFPRGLAVDPTGRLYVADDFNKRVLIFDPPFENGESAADSIGAGADGGFSSPKGLAMVGHTLFVADYYNNRVLRFTGPFHTPDEVYVATGSFTGLNHPVDVAVHPDGSLLVTDQGNQRIARYYDAVWSNSSMDAPHQTFVDYLNPEPLGIAADRAGRIYMADYRAFRVLIRDEWVNTWPISGIASEATQALLADLHARVNRVDERVAIGQQLRTYQYGAKNDPNAWYGDWLKLEQWGFPLPEVMGGELSDLMNYPGFSPNQDALNELIRHGQAGHIVTLVWHPSNPTWGDFGTPISTADLWAMTDDATEIGQRWQTQLDRATAVLQQFKDAGVPVLFRPMHEQNGTFFWWGHNGATGAALRERQAAWVAVWRDLVTEMTTRKELNNILFMFGTNHVNYDGVAAPMTYYPGGYWADVVSIDVYDEELDLAGSEPGVQHYAALVGTGKPFGLAEFGQSFGDAGTDFDGWGWDARTLANRIRASYPRTVFATAWYSSWQGGTPYIFGLPDVSYSWDLLHDPLFDKQ